MKPCEKMKECAGTFLRLGLGVVFVYHGYGKVFGGTNLGTSWHPELPTIVQALVAWGELLCGAAILLGLYTCLASIGIIIIMAGAIILVHGKKGFGMMGGGYEYNFVLILMSLALMATGPGKASIGKNCGCPCGGSSEGGSSEAS